MIIRLQGNEKTSLKESSLKYLKRNKTTAVEEASQQKELRYSPTSLEHLLKAGINYLDTLNTSAVQLEELDKIRCIGLAQQDTVALAHLIKDQQNQAVSNQKGEEIKRLNNQPVSKSYDTSDFESNEETYESRMNKIKPERSLSARPVQKNKTNLRTVSLSSTFSSSSYSDTNEFTETDAINNATSNKKNLSVQDRRVHIDDQDISMINTISEINSDKKSSTCDEDDELEKSFRQLLPSESHLKKNKLETRGDHSLLYMNDMSQTSFSQLETNQPSGKYFISFYYL